MRKFDLKRALKGEPVVTREGVKVLRIEHFPEATGTRQRLIAVLPGRDGDPKIYAFSENGRYSSFREVEHPIDLLMESSKKTVNAKLTAPGECFVSFPFEVDEDEWEKMDLLHQQAAVIEAMRKKHGIVLEWNDE